MVDSEILRERASEAVRNLLSDHSFKTYMVAADAVVGDSIDISLCVRSRLENQRKSYGPSMAGPSRTVRTVCEIIVTASYHDLAIVRIAGILLLHLLRRCRTVMSCARLPCGVDEFVGYVREESLPVLAGELEGPDSVREILEVLA